MQDQAEVLDLPGVCRRSGTGPWRSRLTSSPATWLPAALPRTWTAGGACLDARGPPARHNPHSLAHCRQGGPRPGPGGLGGPEFKFLQFGDRLFGKIQRGRGLL